MESLATLLRGVQPHYEPVDLASLLKKLLWDKHLKTRIIGSGGSAEDECKTRVESIRHLKLDPYIKYSCLQKTLTTILQANGTMPFYLLSV